MVHPQGVRKDWAHVQFEDGDKQQVLCRGDGRNEVWGICKQQGTPYQCEWCFNFESHTEVNREDFSRLLPRSSFLK